MKWVYLLLLLYFNQEWLCGCERYVDFSSSAAHLEVLSAYPLQLQESLNLSIPNSEYYALYDLYISTHGKYWFWPVRQPGIKWSFANSSSATMSDPCIDSWQGVNCSCQVYSNLAIGNDSTLCNVVGIRLPIHNMTGTLPCTLSNLTFLRSLELGRNRISGTLPDSLGSLSRMVTLDLRSNDFFAAFPSWFNNLTSLRVLNISHNLFYSSIPESLYSMQWLELLDISENTIEGSLSPNISNMIGLRTLNLGNNVMTGTLPPELAALTNLTRLNLDSALMGIYGEFPYWLCNMTQLQVLRLGWNGFGTQVPSQFGQLTNLTVLALNDNFFSESIPASILGLTRLEQLELQNNIFYNSIPAELGNMTNMTLLNLAGNAFQYALPCDALQRMKKLSFLSLRKNILTGKVESCFKGLYHLSFLSVSNNFLSGHLPDEQWNHMINFIASRNMFSGSIPASLWSQINMTIFDISLNQLRDVFPVELTNMSRLSYLSLSANFFYGTLSFYPAPRNRLVQLFLADNLFTGTLPVSLRGYPMMAEVTLSRNWFSGSIPPEWNELTNLHILFVDRNKITGTLDKLVDPSKQPQVSNLDVSQNFFTGTLPEKLFQLPQLASFAAFENCIHGTIPSSICQSISLISLVLDGLSTAKRCRVDLFAGLHDSNVFILDRSLHGTVPACIFNIQSLRTLHFSGNLLSGSLPEFTGNHALKALLISHNRLTGSVPYAVKTGYLNRIDMSYNRFSGKLGNDFLISYANEDFSLQVNALSGEIPSSLTDTLNINLLDGNMFACDVDRSSIPKNDPCRDTYSCGSDEADYSMYSWIAVVGTLTMSVLYILCIRQGIKASSWWRVFVQFYEWLTVYPNPIESDASSANPMLTLLFRFYASLRQLFAILSFILVFVFVPTYVALTASSHTYEIQYGWSVSGVLLQGLLPASVLLCLLGIFALLFFSFVQRTVCSLLTVLGDLSAASKASNQQDASTKKLGLSGDDASSLDRDNPDGLWRKFVVLSMINFLVMAGVNSAYIYVFLKCRASIVTLSQIGMAIFKIFWHEAVLWGMVAYVHVYNGHSSLLIQGDEKRNIDQKTSWQAWISRLGRRQLVLGMYVFSPQDVQFVLVTTLLNNTLVPAVAIALISSTCFYNAIVAAPRVTDSYLIWQCAVFVVVEVADVARCVTPVPVTKTMSYQPPFQYSYQCASTIYINYIPVFVFMFIGVGLLLPALKVSTQLCYQYCLKDDGIKKWLRGILPHIYTAPHTEASDSSAARVLLPVMLVSPEESMPVEPEIESHRRSSMFTLHQRQEHSITRISLCELPLGEVREQMHLQLQRVERRAHLPVTVNITTDPANTLDCFPTNAISYRPPTLIKQEKLVVQIMSYLAILLCFGTVYPPLAVIICVSFAVQSWGNQYLLVSLLTRCRDAQQQDVVMFYVDLFSRQCQDVAPLFASLVMYVLPFFSLLVGYLIFDTAGYAAGWRQGVWCWVLFALWPVLFYWGGRQIVQHYYSSSKEAATSDKADCKGGADVVVSPLGHKDLETVEDRKEDGSIEMTSM